MATTVGFPLGALNQPVVVLDPLVPVIRRTLSEVNFLQAFKVAIDCIDSSPLLNVTLVSLKSAPYIYYSDKALVQEFDNGMTCRLRYSEAAITSLAAVVYNFVFGVVFSALSLVTLGQVKMIVDQMRKHWAHAALAVAAFGIGSIGTVSPDLGIKANYAVGFAVGVVLLQWIEGDAISKICTAYQRHRQEIAQAAAVACRNNGVPENTFSPLLNYLNDHLTNRVQSLSDLMGVVQNAGAHMPQVIPWASPEVVINELVQLASNWRSEPVTTITVPEIESSGRTA